MFTLVSNKIIKIIREHKNLSRKQVYVGICDAATYTRIKNGTQTPNAVTFIRLMERLGVEYKKLFMNIQNLEDYKAFEDSERISKFIRNENYKDAKKMLDIYMDEYV